MTAQNMPLLTAGVAGSNPARGANFPKNLARFLEAVVQAKVRHRYGGHRKPVAGEAALAEAYGVSGAL